MVKVVKEELAVCNESVCLKKETLYLIDSLTLDGELEVDVAEVLTKVVQMFGEDNKLYLGDGLYIKLCDEVKEK